VASRLESLTRPLEAYAIVSDALVQAAGGNDVAESLGYVRNGETDIRGRHEHITIWRQSLKS
jgi:class 3 adenylate cyclase